VITNIQIQRFKSLKEVTLSLGHLNLFVGTNASGKSNFFDALRVLQGIGYGFTIDEILNGKPPGSNSEKWERIRGGSTKALFISKAEDDDSQRNGSTSEGGHLKIGDAELEDLGIILFQISLRLTSVSVSEPIHYAIGISALHGWVKVERLNVGTVEVFSNIDLHPNTLTDPFMTVRYRSGATGRPRNLKFEKSRPVLHQLLRDPVCTEAHGSVIEACISALSNMQRIDPSPIILREYSQTQTVKRMGDRGENFAALINAIQSNEKTKSAYVSWLKQLTPTELDDVRVLKGALEEPLFAITEGGVEYPAPILSDGTLRFAAIAAAFFQPDMPDILTIEEIENGIHPSRLRLLVELLKSRASSNRQVMATTHSPVVLAWLNPADYASTFLCSRDEETGASKIVPLSKIPNLVSLIEKQPIADLFAEGWLEEAL